MSASAARSMAASTVAAMARGSDAGLGIGMAATPSGDNAPARVPVPVGQTTIDAPRDNGVARRLAMRTYLWLITITLLVAACGGSDPGDSKYKQTWTKPYNDTTCADWRDEMTEHQKFVMAGDTLYTQQKKLKPDVGLPSDALIGQFQGQVQGLCLTNPTDDVTTVSFIVWTTGQDVFAP